MKTKILPILIGAALTGFGLASSTFAAATDGVATFTVRLSEIPGNYQNVHCDAVWVADGTGRFIKTLRRDAGSRRQHLIQWAAARGSWPYTAVDGYSGATAPNYTSATYNPITVTWDCRTTNGVLVADGNYRFYAEFTDRNGQGPYTTNGLTFVKGTAPVTNTYPDLPYLKAMQVAYTPLITHDIAILDITPPVGAPDSTVTVGVAVTNHSIFTESFTVVLSNVSLGTVIGTQSVSALTGNSGTRLSFAWDTTGRLPGEYVFEAAAGPVAEEFSLGDNRRTHTLTLRYPIHNVAVDRLLAPVMVRPDSTTNLTVVATNRGDFPETFTVTLTDDTAARLLGTQTIANVPALGASNVVFAWTATNLAIGYHTLQAVASAVAEETILVDNTNRLILAVASVLETNTLVARSNVWRYSDQGLDLASTPWKLRSYYDGNWPEGRGALGYGNATLSTTLGYGPNPESKYPTYYFRTAFNVDFPPVMMLARLRRDDGAVVYVNGAEALRDNLPEGPIGYDTLAADLAGDPNAYAEFPMDPNRVAVGVNQLAVEVHQRNLDSSDITFDLELLGINPQLPRQLDIAVARVEPLNEAVAGDRMHIEVTLANRGNVSDTVTVYLQDTNNDLTIGSQIVTNLTAGGTATLTFDWKTLNLNAGDRTLLAYTVVGGVTNVAGMATATARVTSSGFGLNATDFGALGGRCAVVATSGNYLLLGTGAALEIYDRSNPVSPLKLSTVRLPGLISDLTASSTTAYVACGNAGVQFVDISNPTAPVHRNTFDTSGHAYGVWLAGNNLYVADGPGGLRILTVTNAAAPVLISSYYTDGPARAVQVVGFVAYILDGHHGLTVLNVPNPTAPVLRGRYLGIDDGQAMLVASPNCYIADGQGRLWLLNVASPSAPILNTNLLLNAVGRNLAVSGSTLYVAAGDAGLLAVNAAVPTAPVIAAVVAASDEARDVVVAGTTAYLADGLAGFQVLNISAPTAPTPLGTHSDAGRGSDVALAGDLAYVAAGEAGLRIYTLTNPAAPALLGQLTEAINARCVAVAGTVAYVGDGQHGLRVVNVAEAANLVLLGTLTDPQLGYLRSVAAHGTRAVVTDGRNICLVDATDPAQPVLAAMYPAPMFAYDLALDGTHAYAACGHYGLLLLSTDGTALSYAGTYDTPGLATGVELSGSTAFVADGPGGWLTVNVASPAAPTLIQTSSSQGPVRAVAAAGAMAVLGSGASAAHVVNVSSPLTPVPQATFGPLVNVLRLAINGSVALAAEDAAGLAVLPLPAIEGDGDHDGLPDDWEQQIVNADPDDAIASIQDVQPTDDFDGDGLSNYAEALAGTSPIDAGSTFLMTAHSTANGASVILQWASIAGRTYAVYKTTDLRTGFTLLEDSLAATPPLNTYTDTAGNGEAFYIISVQ